MVWAQAGRRALVMEVVVGELDERGDQAGSRRQVSNALEEEAGRLMIAGGHLEAGGKGLQVVVAEWSKVVDQGGSLQQVEEEAGSLRHREATRD